MNSSTEVHRQLSRAHSLDLIIHHKVTIEVFPRWGLVTKSRPTLATPWTVASQAPLPMGFSRQEYWSGLPCPPPEDRPNPGIKPESSPSPALQVDSLPLSHQGSPQTQYSDTNMLADQVPLSMGFSRQEYWSGLPFPSPGDLPGPGIEPGSPALQPEPPFEPLYHLSH